jgi:hypothetical protein
LQEELQLLRWQLQFTAMPERKTRLATPSADADQKPPLHQGPAGWSGRRREVSCRQRDVTFVRPSDRVQVIDVEEIVKLEETRSVRPVPMVSCCCAATTSSKQVQARTNVHRSDASRRQDESRIQRSARVWTEATVLA